MKLVKLMAPSPLVKMVKAIVGEHRLRKLEKALKYLGWELSPEELVTFSLMVAIMTFILTLLIISNYVTYPSMLIATPLVLSYMAFRVIYEEPITKARSKSLERLRALIPILEEAITRYSLGELDLSSILAHIADSEEILAHLRKGKSPEEILMEIAENEYNPDVARAIRTLTFLGKIAPPILSYYKALVRDMILEAKRLLFLDIKNAEAKVTIFTTLGFFLPLIVALATALGLIEILYLPLTIPAYMLLLTLMITVLEVRGNEH